MHRPDNSKYALAAQTRLRWDYAAYTTGFSFYWGDMANDTNGWEMLTGDGVTLFQPEWRNKAGGSMKMFCNLLEYQLKMDLETAHSPTT